MKALARYQLILLGKQRHIDVNNLPKVVARQCRQIYLLIAIFAIGEQKSVLAKQRRMHFVTSDKLAKSDRSRL